MNELRISFPFSTFGRRLVAENFGGGSGGAGGSPAEINTFSYDAFSQTIGESNAVASITYLRDALGNCTNETTIVAGGPQSPAAAETYSIDREFDAHSRLVRHGDTYYTYASDGRLTVISNAEAFVEYAYTSDRFDADYTLTLTNGTMFSRTVVRDAYRRSLVTAITNSVNGVPVEILSYAYDALGRPVSRNNDTFGYNDRSEVTSAILHSPFSILHSYGYDDIGNSTNWTANGLNQYTAISGGPTSVSAAYDLDGNLLSDGNLSFTYDAANRLSSVTSNGVALAAYSYDSQGRRIRKVTPSATHTYFYDGWLLVRETLVTSHSSLVTDYVWGKDLSGTLQGAGGVGGLLYLTVSNSNSNSPLQLYVPFYDNNGNVTHYCDAAGNVVAEYTYDAFGNTIAQSGPMANYFAIRFSTKYFDCEANLYYYGYRYYCPKLMRWLNRDPVGEKGGVNLYAFCGNNGVSKGDMLGKEVFVIDQLPGVEPPLGWGSTLDAAQVEAPYYRNIVLRFKNVGKNCYILYVEFTIPNTIIYIYYRYANTPFIKAQELEHVDCHKCHWENALDNIFMNYNGRVYTKQNLEKTKNEIFNIQRQAEENKEKCNYALDAPGGPHGH